MLYPKLCIIRQLIGSFSVTGQSKRWGLESLKRDTNGHCLYGSILPQSTERHSRRKICVFAVGCRPSQVLVGVVFYLIIPSVHRAKQCFPLKQHRLCFWYFSYYPSHLPEKAEAKEVWVPAVTVEVVKALAKEVQ